MYQKAAILRRQHLTTLKQKLPLFNVVIKNAVSISIISNFAVKQNFLIRKILKISIIILLAAKAKANEEEIIKTSCRKGMRGCGSHVRPLRFLSGLNYSMKEIYYDPNFYKFRALAETAKMFKAPIQANVNLKDLSSKEQMEIDGF